MNHPIELTIAEPLPGQFVWHLLETNHEGKEPRVLRSAFEAADSYELALASGQRALKSEIRQHAAHGHPA